MLTLRSLSAFALATARLKSYRWELQHFYDVPIILQIPAEDKVKRSV